MLKTRDSNQLLDAAFLRAVLEAIPSLVARLDSEQRVRCINHLSGAELEQVIGRPVREFIEPEDYSRYEQAASRALLTGEVCSYTARTPREGMPSAGIPRATDYECHVVPIDDADGGRGLCIVASDISAHVKREAALQAAQRNDLIGNLTSGIAHNFNNMLAIIEPALELALKQSSSDQRRSLEDALHASQRASELVGQLMTFTGQRRPAARGSVDLMRLIERTVSMCERTLGCRVQLQSCAPLTAAFVSGDPISIEQVLVNLLVNARDALAEVERTDACVRVSLREQEASCPDWGLTGPQRYYCLRVDDNGVGMSAAIKDRVFEPFFTTKKPGKGNGLGLSTSFGIVRDLGGFISVESQPHEGTSVSVYLPPMAADTGAASASAARSPGPCGTVLVIDDEPAIRRVIELILRNEGHDVHVAADGQAGVAQLDAGLRPDLILLDRSMPGWSPRVTLAELRKRLEHVPILFFTGQEVTSEERAQVQDVLYKPLSPRDFVRSVERWLLSALAPHGAAHLDRLV